MRRNLAKIFGFAAGLIILICLLSIVFDGSRWLDLSGGVSAGVGQGYVADRDARIAGITIEEPGLIDVLNVGDSVCNISLTPMETRSAETDRVLLLHTDSAQDAADQGHPLGGPQSLQG